MALAVAVMGLSLLASQSRSGLGSLTIALVLAGGWLAPGEAASTDWPCHLPRSRSPA